MGRAKGTGTPWKLNRKMIARLAEARGDHGLAIRVCCAVVDVKPGTYYEWMTLGREHIAEGRTRTVHAVLVQAMEGARARFEETLAKRIIEAAMVGDKITKERVVVDHTGAIVTREIVTLTKQDWRAAKFLAAVNFPDRWSERLIAELRHEGRIQIGDAQTEAVTEVTIELISSDRPLDPQRERALALPAPDAPSTATT